MRERRQHPEPLEETGQQKKQREAGGDRIGDANVAD